VYETLFFRAFNPRQINGGQVSCFREGFSMDLLTTSNLQQATCYMHARLTTDY